MPADFNETEPGTDPEIVKRAKQLSEQLQIAPQPREASSEAVAKLESEFDRQVEYFATLQAKLDEARRILQALQNDGALLSSTAAIGTA